LLNGNDVAVHTGSGSTGLKVTAGGAGVVVDVGGNTNIAKNLTIGGTSTLTGVATTSVDPRDHPGDLGSATKEYNKTLCRRRRPDGDPDRHGYDDRFEYHQTQYQPADRPGSVDESMENVLHQRRSDFRNAERDRRVL
jgi:hypothetical protein